MRKWYITSRKWTVMIIAVLVAAAGTVCCLAIPGSRSKVSPEVLEPAQVYVTVHISGCVAKPDQLVTLPEGSRISDAIAAAGGATEEADLSRLNLAALLKDGQKITVPSQNEEQAGSGPVNINTASLEELDTLPGIGPSLAQRIITYREENGAFADIAELMNVSGIGEKLFSQLEEKIRI